MSKIGHIEVAVLMKVNQLAERYGVDLWRFDAEFDTETGELSFPSVPGGDQQVPFDKMMTALGCDNCKLQLDDSDLLERLDEALFTAPRPRIR